MAVCYTPRLFARCCLCLTFSCYGVLLCRYVGFLDETGASIDSVTIRCKSTYPNALALMRVGKKVQKAVHV